MAPEVSRCLAQAPPQATGVLIVDLAALRRNYRKLCDAAPRAETAAVLKADGYGLGASNVAEAVSKEGCRTFFVAALTEAERLRATAPTAVLYVLDGLLPRTAPLFAEIAARPVLGSLEEAAEWAAFCRGRRHAFPAALHIDTGMTRLGLSADDARRLAADEDTLAGMDLSLVMSHLACADDAENPKSEAQRLLFEELSALFPGRPRSLANSAGLSLGAPFHFEMTRAGVSLYGGRARLAGGLPIEPVVHLFGRIAQVSWQDEGITVGYGATQRLKRRTRVATVCVGYADGYIRAASANDMREGPSGYIGDFRCPLLGRISMDLTAFDATDAPEALARRGGWVELLGKRVTVDDFAASAGTIGYEVLTSLGRRFYRVYCDA